MASSLLLDLARRQGDGIAFLKAAYIYLYLYLHIYPDIHICHISIDDKEVFFTYDETRLEICTCLQIFVQLDLQTVYLHKCLYIICLHLFCMFKHVDM